MGHDSPNAQLTSSPRAPMARPRTQLHACRAAAATVWTTSAVLFVVILRAAMRNSFPPAADPGASFSERRARLYDEMARDLDDHGAAFLRGGETSQSLSLSEIFDVRGGVVTPRLRAADPPVRATVLYLSPEFSKPLSQAVRDIFLPYFSGVIWLQNTSLYHFSMFHASHHITPVVAAENEIKAEADAVKRVAEFLCPLNIVLDRVVLTSTGVLLGCWQVTSGMDPFTIRAKLRNALPRAPEKQLYNPVMLHTSFARLLGHPKTQMAGLKESSAHLEFFHDLVTQVNKKIHGFQATVSEIWFVEEYDVLALALNGRTKAHKFNLGCTGN